jgi:VanZ family protein
LEAYLRERNLLNAAFFTGFLLVILVVAPIGLSKRPGRFEIWAALGIAAVYGMVLTRAFINPVERTHLFEYSLLAVFIYQAFIERVKNGGKVPAPAFLAVLLTALLGWLDEGIQWLLPNRVYDIRDVGFNALAGLMAIAAILVLGWARNLSDKLLINSR